MDRTMGKCVTRQNQGANARSRDNNFNILRLIAAVMIFCGHLSVLMGGTAANFCGFSIQDMGLHILFLISGYLMTMSWLHDPNPARFAIRRFFRFYVPFAVMVVVMVYIAGPLVSDLGASEYFHTSYPLSHRMYLRNLLFYPVYAQPGVFTDVPVPYQTNSSLWTMPVEGIMYVITPVLLTAFRVKKKGEEAFRPMAVFTAAACGLTLYLRLNPPAQPYVLYGTDVVRAAEMASVYFTGMLFTFEKVRRYLNQQMAAGIIALFLLTDRCPAAVKQTVFILGFPYIIFSFALSPEALFRKAGRWIDAAYGIYLYGFFFEQLVIQRLGASAGYTRLFWPGIALTSGAAVLSCVLIEKPAVRAGRMLTSRLRQKQNSRKTLKQ